MRFPPAHAAPRDSAPPPKRRMPKSLRTALSVAVVGVIGFVPAVVVSSTAQAAPSDFLTIADAGNWEGNAITFTATYTGPSVASFRFATAPGTATLVTTDYTELATSAYGSAARTVTDLATNSNNVITSVTAQFNSLDVGSAIGGGSIPGGTTIATVVSPTSATLSAPALSTATGVTAVITGTGPYIEFPASTAGVPSKATVTVATAADADTVDQAFQLVATPAVPLTGPVQSATGTIWAVPSYPIATLSAPSPVSEAVSSVAVTASLSLAVPHEVTIPVLTKGPSTVALQTTATTALSTGGVNRDFTALPATAKIVIPAGQVTGSISVDIWDDNVDEPATQYFEVATTGTILGATGPANVEIGITDNDAAPTVSIGNASAVAEGAPTASFPITLSSLSENALSVTFSTSAGTDTATSHSATDLADYTGTTISVPIPALNSTVNKTVAILADEGTVEGTETFTASLSAPSVGLTLGTPVTATGTITDATTGPLVRMDTGSVSLVDPDEHTFAEGVSGELVTYIPVLVTAPARQAPMIIDYSFTDGTATNGVDYRGASGTLTVPAATTGALTLQIPVTIIGDTLYEGTSETFTVALASSNGTIDPATVTPVTFTITENVLDDVQRTWTTGDISVVEGNSGTATAKVPVTMSGVASADVTFNASFTGTNSATETGVSSGTTVGDNDYDLPTLRTVTIPAGSKIGYLNIPINSDAIYERTEAFTVTLATASTLVTSVESADVQFTSRVNITNDDAAPTVVFNQLSATEGSTLRVTATTVGLSQYAYDLGFAVAPTGTNRATAGLDYDVETVPVPSHTVARGTQGALLLRPVITDVYLMPDDLNEATETFGVTATETTPLSTGIATTTGVYRILGTGTPNPSESPSTEPSTEPSTDPSTEPSTDPSTEPTEPEPTVDPTDPIVSLASPISYRRGVGDITLTGNSTVPGAEIQTWVWPLGTTAGWVKYKSPFQSDETTGDFTFIATLTHVGAKFAASITVGEEQWTSGTVVIHLRQNPVFSVRSSTKGTATVTVFGDPRIQGLKVRFLEANRDGTYRTVGTGETTISGRFVYTIQGLKSGTSHLYKATVYGDSDVGLLTNTSRSARVTIR